MQHEQSETCSKMDPDRAWPREEERWPSYPKKTFPALSIPFDANRIFFLFWLPVRTRRNWAISSGQASNFHQSASLSLFQLVTRLLILLLSSFRISPSAGPDARPEDVQAALREQAPEGRAAGRAEGRGRLSGLRARNPFAVERPACDRNVGIASHRFVQTPIHGRLLARLPRPVGRLDRALQNPIHPNTRNSPVTFTETTSGERCPVLISSRLKYFLISPVE